MGMVSGSSPGLKFSSGGGAGGWVSIWWAVQEPVLGTWPPDSSLIPWVLGGRLTTRRNLLSVFCRRFGWVCNSHRFAPVTWPISHHTLFQWINNISCTFLYQTGSSCLTNFQFFLYYTQCWDLHLCVSVFFFCTPDYFFRTPCSINGFADRQHILMLSNIEWSLGCLIANRGPATSSWIMGSILNSPTLWFPHQ